jgi:hypothetical protein
MGRFWIRHRAWISVGLLALLLRAWAALQLPTDFDEPIYLQAGYDYAAALRAGDLNGVIDYAENREHPALVKLLYGLGVLALGERASWEIALLVARAISAGFGVLAAVLLGLVNPLAGGVLAVHTLTVKYTSQAYLEALPLFAAIAAALALQRSRAASPLMGEGERDRWFWLSALSLGLTAAGKYTYFPIVFVILYLALWEKKLNWRDVLLYFAAAAAVFGVLNPTLWRDPIARLIDSIAFHARYTGSADVQLAAYPWYQPLVWLFQSVPWHPEVFFYGFDEIIFILAMIGLPREWRERRWLIVWIAGGLAFLLLWPTKWPQYALVVVPALCLSAATTAQRLYRQIKEQFTYWPILTELLPHPPRGAWLAAGAFILVAMAVVVGNTLQLTLGRLGWSRLTTANSLLPGAAVFDIQAGPSPHMILATDRGLAIWSPPDASDRPDVWRVFNTANSGLPHNRVLAVAQDAANTLWLGTQAGLGRYDGTGWRVFRALDLGLAGDQVQAVEIGNDGRVWIGADAGLAVFDGRAWTAFTTATSGLIDDAVFSLAVEPRLTGDVIWIGTGAGVSRFDPISGEWTAFTPENSGLGWGGVADLLIDSSGRVWAATLGGGLSIWDGRAWQAYRTSNSAVPFNTVQAIFEAAPGVLWVGTAVPNNAGGVVAAFDGQTWTTYTPRNSGYSGAEPLSIARDQAGRIWIGTQLKGVDIYQIPP